MPAKKKRADPTRKPRRGRDTIDNTRYPTTDEVGKLLGVPPERVKELKELVARIRAGEIPKVG